MVDDIEEIVGCRLAWYWKHLDGLKVYRKDDVPYGAIGYKDVDGVKYLACTTQDSREYTFTIAMLRDIIGYYNTCKICLVVDTESRIDLIRRSLSRFEFTDNVVDGVGYFYGGYDENKLET